MKLIGLECPLPTNDTAVYTVLAATAATLGFGLGSWLLDAPLDRAGAVALFVGMLYVLLADPFLSMKDSKIKRYAVAGAGAGILIALAAVMERFASS